MPKIFRCDRCKKEVGDMTKGKIKKDAVVICSECNYKLKVAEMAAKNNASSNPLDVLGGLFT